MYIVRQQGKIVEVFQFFSDAWLFVYLECECYALILEPGGDTWVVNPAYRSYKPIN